MRELLCWMLGHRASRHTAPRYAIVFHCERCRKLVPGGLALPERYR